MPITLNRFTARLLMIALLPIVLPIKLFNVLTGKGKQPVYVGTVEGDPLTYDGDRPILVALWASWASIWRSATESVVEQLRNEFAGRCEFAYVEVANRSVLEAYRAEVVPVLILRRHGEELGRFVNTLGAEEVRRAIEKCLEARVADAPEADSEPSG